MMVVTYADASVLVGGVGVVVAGDDDEGDTAGGAGVGGRCLPRLEEVDLGADVALEVAGVEHAGAADGEVHAARQDPAGGDPADLVRHRRRHTHGRSCTPQGSNKRTDTWLIGTKISFAN